MSPSGSTQVSARTAADHLRRPTLGTQPTPVTPSGARTGAAGGVGGAVDLLARLDGIRARLGSLAPLVHDEAARRLAVAVREVDALREDLVRPAPGDPATVPAVPPAGATPTPPVAPAAAPGSAPPVAAPLPTTRHRPPALPCGPDYPLLQGHRGV